MQLAQQRSAGAAANGSRAALRPLNSGRRVLTVRATPKHQDDKVGVAGRVAPSLLAALVVLSGGMSSVDAAFPAPARADEDETMSPYQKRQADLEKRRELLREAREKAAARAAAGTAAPAAAPAEKPTEAPSAPKPVAPSLSYQAATKNRPSLPPPEPAMESPTPPAFGGFSFSKPAAAPPAAEAPKPAPAPSKPAAAPSAGSGSSSLFSSDMFNTPIKPKAADVPTPPPAPRAPAPVVVPPPPPAAPFRAPEPVRPPPPAVRATPAPAAKPAAKPATKPAAAAKPGKRRGPLPLWLAEVLVLAGYVGAFLAATKYSKQSGEALAAVWAKIVAAYAALEKLAGGNKGQAV